MERDGANGNLRVAPLVLARVGELDIEFFCGSIRNINPLKLREKFLRNFKLRVIVGEFELVSVLVRAVIERTLPLILAPTPASRLLLLRAKLVSLLGHSKIIRLGYQGRVEEIGRERLAGTAWS